MDLLRAKKREIMDTVKDGKKWTDENGKERELVGVVEFFKERGITITTIGQFGGFTYENPEIQKSIDEVFHSRLHGAVSTTINLAAARHSPLPECSQE